MKWSKQSLNTVAVETSNMISFSYSELLTLIFFYIYINLIVFLFSSESVEAPEDSKCWQPAVIIIRSTNHKWPYKLSLSIHCKFHQSYHFSLAVTSVLTTPGSHTVGRSRLTSCVLGEGHQNQKVERPLRFVSTLSHSKVMYHIP